jgi:hypothetical protein
MSAWAPAFSLAIFVATIPLLWVFRILTGLPKPLALSHRRWPLWGSFALIGFITVTVAVFIRGIYAGGPEEPTAFLLQFLIAAVIYLFGIALLLRQFVGLYPEYFVTTGPTGLAMRKALYRHVVDLEEVSQSHEESELRIHMRSGASLQLLIPTRHLPVLRRAIQESQPEP